MQEAEDNNILPVQHPLPKEDAKLLVGFFDLLLQWEIEDEQRQKQEN